MSISYSNKRSASVTWPVDIGDVVAGKTAVKESGRDCSSCRVPDIQMCAHMRQWWTRQSRQIVGRQGAQQLSQCRLSLHTLLSPLQRPSTCRLSVLALA
jgi:hypothetical protein